MATLTIQTLSGSLLSVESSSIETVGGLKKAIQEQRGTNRYQQRILLWDRALEDDVALTDLGDPPPHLNLVSLTYRADGDATQALADAIDEELPDQVERLLRLPTDPNGLAPKFSANPPVFHAARAGNLTIAELLVEAMADPNARCTYFCEYLDNPVTYTPLLIAAQHPDGAVAKILCQVRADVNAVDEKGDAPLTIAVRDGNSGVVRELVGAGADIDKFAEEGDDDCGRTVLQKAAWKNDLDMLKCLCDLGADVNLADDDGHTPLAASVWAGGDGPASRLLLAARADVDAGNPSPLALAMRGEDREAAQFLIEAGATKAAALAGTESDDTADNVYFIGHQNSAEQRRAVDSMIGAHNADAEWLQWFDPRKALSITQHVVLPPEPACDVIYSWRRAVGHCTHGAVCQNNCRAARETTYDYMPQYNRTRTLQLTIEYMYEDMLARLCADRGCFDHARDRSRSPRAAAM